VTRSGKRWGKYFQEPLKAKPFGDNVYMHKELDVTIYFAEGYSHLIFIIIIIIVIMILICPIATA